MSASAKSQQARAEALLDYVRSAQAQHCAELREQGRQHAEALVREAFKSARARAQTAIAEERRLLQRQYTEAEAQLATRRRQQAQRRDGVLLQKARERLREVLLARWQQPAQRQHWLRHAASQALEWLPRAPRWLVEHASGMDETECLQFKAMLQLDRAAAMEFMPNADLGAGLRIHADGVVLDTSLAGLLADQAALDARLLFHLRASEAVQA